MDKFRFNTKAVRSGQTRTSEKEHSDPIFATSSFVFDNAKNAADLFAERETGNIYSRFTNPTVRAFERRLATLEDAEYCIGTASGMSAILTLCLTHLKAGDHIVAATGLFGSTINLFNNILSKFQLSTSYVSTTNISDWQSAIQDNTRLLFVESPSNPLCEIFDIRALSKLSSSKDGCLLAVDNCVCTPALQQPLELGADVVVHSSTKFLDGQGRAVGGAVVTNVQSLAVDLYRFLRSAGPSMSPFNAWVFHKGLETLAIRMKAASESANTIANFLEEHASVARVHYPGLENHPNHALAAKQQKRFGAVVSFEVDSGTRNAWRVIDELTCYSITANIGDVKSIVTHPATTTHSRITQEERNRAGISDGLIRLSIGLEDIDDLVSDLSNALDTIK